MSHTKDAGKILLRLRRKQSINWTVNKAQLHQLIRQDKMKIFLIFLLLFNISFDTSRAYFYQSESGASADNKQCFCEVSLYSWFHDIPQRFPVNFLFLSVIAHERVPFENVFITRKPSRNSTRLRATLNVAHLSERVRPALISFISTLLIFCCFVLFFS